MKKETSIVSFCRATQDLSESTEEFNLHGLSKIYNQPGQVKRVFAVYFFDILQLESTVEKACRNEHCKIRFKAFRNAQFIAVLTPFKAQYGI